MIHEQCMSCLWHVQGLQQECMHKHRCKAILEQSKQTTSQFNALKPPETDMVHTLTHSSCEGIFVTNIAIKDEFQQDG